MRLDGRLLPRFAFGLLAHQNEWMMTIPIIKKVASLLLFCFGVCLIFAGCGSRESGSVLSQTQYIERLRAEGFLAPDDTTV